MKRSPAAFAALFLAVTCFGCDPHRTLSSTRGGDALELVASSPVEVVTLFAARWRARDASGYLSLLTRDFGFTYGPGDSAGSSSRVKPWDFAAESTFVTHMLVGGGARVPLSDVQVRFVGSLTPTADLRPGHANRWHRLVRVFVYVTGAADSAGVQLLPAAWGASDFYLVRGDSARTRPGCALGDLADSTSWYLERWDDLGSGHDEPPLTLGGLRQRWLEPAAAKVAAIAR